MQGQQESCPSPSARQPRDHRKHTLWTQRPMTLEPSLTTVLRASFLDITRESQVDRAHLLSVWVFSSLPFRRISVGYLSRAVLSCSVMSDSATTRTVAHQAALPIRILQARILEWVAMPSSRGSSQCRDRTHVSCITGEFFTIWATRVDLYQNSYWKCNHSLHNGRGYLFLGVNPSR